jgi:hypothetical protein
MTRQLVIISTLAAALLCSPAALAGKHDHDNDGGKHWKDHNNNWNHHAHGHRHYWHGQWWDYGVGPCWIRTPVGWIWTCGD